MKVISISTTIAALAATVSAHGGVGKYIIGGTEYVGWQPYNSAAGQSSIQRQYSSFDPILTTTGTNIRCNNQGQTSQLHAPIKAGDAITAVWTQWTHAEGPVTVYMAKCPGSCADFDGSGAVWFKIDEAGLLSGTVNKGKWGNGVVLDTLKWTSTVPASLAPGNYLIRHDVLALHQANTPQFYPECAQLTVSSSGTASPSAEYLCALPGCFSMSDPGVTIDIYSSTATTYKVPGPPVWPNGSAPPPAVSSSVAPPPAVTSASKTSTAPPPPPTSTPKTSTSAAPQPTTTSPSKTSTAPQQTSTTSISKTSPAPQPTATTPTSPGGTVQKWGQCGGINHTGPTTCVSGSTCTKFNDWYSQCV